MKKLLMATSVALLALSFQASAAPLPGLTLSKQDKDTKDLRNMILDPEFATSADYGQDVSGDYGQVVGSGVINNRQSFTHDWGISLHTSYKGGKDILTGLRGYLAVTTPGIAKTMAISFYSGTVFTEATKFGNSYHMTNQQSFSQFYRLNDAAHFNVSRYSDSQWELNGQSLQSDKVYGLRIQGEGAGYGSYTFSISPVPIPGAVWLFGSGIAGLLGLSRRKAKIGTLSV